MLATFAVEVENVFRGLLVVVICVAVFLWFLPAILVALRADSEGFSMWGFLLVALTLGWPFALALTLTFGRRSPLVVSLQRRGQDEDSTRIVHGASGERV